MYLTVDPKTLLQNGIATAKAGQREQARSLLLQVVEVDPKNLVAWLWLSDLVDDIQDRMIALENALMINPNQPQVQQRLDLIKAQAEKTSRPAEMQTQSDAPQKFSDPQNQPPAPVPKLDLYSRTDQPPVGLADQFMADLFRSDVAEPQDLSGDANSALSEVSPQGDEVNNEEIVDKGTGFSRLGEFSPHLSEEHMKNEAVRLETAFSEAVTAFNQGKRQAAIDLLHQVVWNDSQNDKAWLMLSEAAFDIEEKIEGLSKALAINPNIKDGKTRLEAWTKLIKSPTDLGQWYEQNGDLGRAQQTYLKASMNARSHRDKAEADRLAQRIDRRIHEPEVKFVAPTWIVLRLSIGPILLYMLLVVIQSGFNLLSMDPVLILGLLFVIPGSILLVIATTRPTHPAWVPFFKGLGANREGVMRFITAAVGFILLLVPYTILIIGAVSRLEALRLSNP